MKIHRKLRKAAKDITLLQYTDGRVEFYIDPRVRITKSHRLACIRGIREQREGTKKIMQLILEDMKRTKIYFEVSTFKNGIEKKSITRIK